MKKDLAKSNVITATCSVITYSVSVSSKSHPNKCSGLDPALNRSGQNGLVVTVDDMQCHSPSTSSQLLPLHLLHLLATSLLDSRKLQEHAAFSNSILLGHSPGKSHRMLWGAP